MKKGFEEKIEIPEGISAEVGNRIIRMKADEKEISKRIIVPGLNFKKEENNIVIESKRGTKRDKTMVGTVKAHIKNMITGLKDGFEYKLKICSSHFPMSVNVENNLVTIKNFLGEKIPRKAKILEGVNVSVSGDEIIVNGHNIEDVGQTAANIEQACRINKRDRRRFQDGCYITSKAGKEI